MKKWINSVRKVQSTMLCTSYFWKVSRCELCRSTLITEFIHDDVSFYLLKFELPVSGNDFLVLEQISADDHKMLHVLDIDRRDANSQNSSTTFQVGSAPS